MEIEAQEWLRSQDPWVMLQYLLNRFIRQPGSIALTPLSHRKLRLFACATARLLEDTPPRPERTAVIEACELIADNLPSQWGKDESGLRGAGESIGSTYGWTWAATKLNLLYSLERSFTLERGNAGSFHRQAEVAALLRDIVGNPFRPVVLPAHLARCKKCHGTGGYWEWLDEYQDSEWRYCRECNGQATVDEPCPWLTWHDGAVARLAEAIYQERDFSPVRLSILADTLEEAGCEQQSILSHLRATTVTVREEAWRPSRRDLGSVCRHCGGRLIASPSGIDEGLAKSCLQCIAVTRPEMEWHPPILATAHRFRGDWVIDLLTGRA